MFIYNYNPKTGEYTDKQTADEDKEATKRLGEFTPMVPAYATLIEPPKAPKGYAIVFENGNWKLKADYRGKKVISPTTEETTTVDYIGELKDGFVFYDDYIKSDEYKKKQEQAETKRIKMLSMTPLDFINAIEKEFGITYAQVKALCDSNAEVDKQLRFCNNVYRGNELLDGLCAQFGVTPVQLDELFKKYGA